MWVAQWLGAVAGELRRQCGIKIYNTRSCICTEVGVKGNGFYGLSFRDAKEHILRRRRYYAIYTRIYDLYLRRRQRCFAVSYICAPFGVSTPNECASHVCFICGFCVGIVDGMSEEYMPRME